MNGISIVSTPCNRAVARAQTNEPSRRTHRNVMKWLATGFAVAAALLSPSSSRAYLQTYDGFDYSLGTPGSIDGFNGGIGWTNVVNSGAAWGAAGLGGAASEIVVNGSLTNPGGTLYATSNHVYSAGGFAGRFFNIPPNWAFPGQKYYFSFVMRPENTPATNHYYGLQLFSDNNNSPEGGHDLFIGKTGTNLNYGLEYNTNNIVGGVTNTVFVDAFSSTAAVSNQTVLLVVRVTFAAGVPDSFALYVNPTPGVGEPVTPSATITDDIGTANGLGLNSGNGGLVSFDEIRIGSTFASVTPASSVPDSNLLTWEPFAYNTYTSPVTLDGQNGGAGWDSVAWGQFFFGATAYINVSGSLAGPGNSLLTSGGHETTTGGFAGRYPLLTNYTAATSYGTPGTTNYFSVLIRPDSSVTPSNYWGMQLSSNNGGQNLFIGKSGSSLAYGLEYSTNEIVGSVTNTVFVDALSGTQAASNQTVFLVTRVVFLPSGTSDQYNLYVNPTPGGPEPATPSATLTGFLGNQNGVAFNSGDNGSGGTQVSFDEVRVGTTFADVTPPSMRILSVVRSANNIVLTWPAAVGTTNTVQATTGSNGSYSNNFVDIGAPIIIPGSSGPVVTNPPAIGSSIRTNYVDSLGATNKARYYRIRQTAP